ncbi:unnamed protein product [Gordionus sp. m RMFG-2023]
MGETLYKYIESIKPFVDKKYTKKLEDFVKLEIGTPDGIGQKLKEELNRYSNEHINWAYEPWLREMYLNQRLPLPINFNPGMVMPRQTFETLDSFCWFAAKVINGILIFKAMIEKNKLNTDLVSERYHQHLCMQQYQHLFDCYRCPRLVQDVWLFSKNKSKHIIVMYKNQIYKVEIMDDMEMINIPSLKRVLEKLITDIDNDNDFNISNSVSYLTTLPRSDWALIRDKLLLNNKNRTSLNAIETCLFCLCLDEEIDESKNNCIVVWNIVNIFKFILDTFAFKKNVARNDESLFFQAIHGGGVTNNSGNRWFDKTIQVIIGKDGFYGLSYEHSVCEALVIIRLFEFVLKNIRDDESNKDMIINSDPAMANKLLWNLNVELQDSIIRAVELFQIQINRLNASILHFDNFGREFPKSQNCSPDGFIQLALQLTYYKIHKRITHTYESASLRRFIKGRVDNIRAAHEEALEWVKVMVQDNEEIQNKIDYFQKAIEKQSNIINQTINGYGIDNHMLLMKTIGEETDLKFPLFDDKTYEDWNYFRLSTSQIPTQELFFMGYGPVVLDGYGCSYNPHKDTITFVITTFNDCTTTDINKFRENLISSLLEMKELLLRR